MSAPEKAVDLPDKLRQPGSQIHSSTASRGARERTIAMVRVDWPALDPAGDPRARPTDPARGQTYATGSASTRWTPTRAAPRTAASGPSAAGRTSVDAHSDETSRSRSSSPIAGSR